MVIVGSILLAFWIDAAWAERQEREFERDALARLEVEFMENRIRLGQRAPRSSGLHELMQSIPVEATELSVPDSLLIALLAVPTFDRVTPVLDGLVGSGRYESIRDPGVRELVARWERGLAQLTEREAGAMNFVDGRLRPQLARYGDLSRVYSRYGAPRPGGLRVDGTATTLRVDDDLKELVAEKHAREENITRIRDGLEALIDDLLMAIRAVEEAG